MINKKSIWFVTLFSLILVLSVYYVTMPNELLLTNNSNSKTEKVSSSEKNDESAELVALRVDAEEEMLSEINNLKAVMVNEKSSSNEKNKAFEQMKDLNKNRGQEESMENLIKKEFSLKAFVKIKDKDITVVIDSTKHNVSEANNIMRKIQSQFEEKMYITVKFQK